MSYLSSTERARIRALIVAKNAQLVVANATYLKLLSQDTLEYRFNSGEGAQWATKRSIKEISEQIALLEDQIANLTSQLNSGGGLVNLVLRRQ